MASSAEEELFATVFHSSPHPIGITELETGRCLEVNDACLESFGFSRDEVIGQTTLLLGIWPDPQARAKLIARLHSEGSIRNVEVTMQMKNGDLRHLVISADLITLKGKQCLLMAGNDVTERMQVEEALRLSEERWQLVGTGTTDGIWDWDVARHTVFLSARWKQVRGYREEEIGVEETEWSSRIHPEDSSRVMAMVQSYFNKEIPTFQCEYRTRCKDGTYFWISDRGIAVWDAQGQVVRMVGSETDITERKRAEAELRHSEAQFRTVVQSAPNGILLVDGRGRIVLVNGEIERQFGYRREELIGHSVERLVPGRSSRDHADLREAYQEAPEARAMGRGRDLYGLRKDGSELPIEIGLNSIETISGTMVLVSVVDITERKQREYALAEQRRLYKTVTDNAALALFIMDDSQQCMFMNPAAEALTGFTLAEVMGRPLHDVVHRTRPDGSPYPLSECPIDRAFPRNDREQGEEVFVHKHGHFYSVAFTASPIRNELGQPVGTVIEVQDITERKQAEAERQKFVSLADRSLEFIGMCNLDFKPFYVNEAGRRFVGLDSLEQACAVCVKDYFFPEDQAMIIGEFFPSVLRHGHGEIVVRFRHFKTGEALWMIYNVFQIMDENGRVVGYATVSRDITERKRAEEALHELNETLEQHVTERTVALRKSEERFRTFLDNAPSVAFMKTCDGRYLYVNRRFEEAFQLEQNEIVGKMDVELFSREQAELFQSNDRFVFEAGKAMEFEETSLYADGRHTNIVVKFPVRDGAGHVYAIGGIVTDITDRKKTELTLQQNQLALQEKRQELQRLTEQLLMAQDSERQRIARDLHDDFSQRLAALTLDVAALQRQPPLLPELIRKALEPVREELTQLTNDLHELSYRLHPSLLKHAGLGAALEEHIHQAMRRTGLHMTLKVSTVADSLPLDLATCLFRVCQESLQNVAKHANATDVLVKLSGSTKGIGLSVTDNGTGFDPHDKSSHQKGLGLTSMKQRLRLLNGFLNIHSRPADGTKVCAWIPFQEKAP